MLFADCGNLTELDNGEIDHSEGTVYMSVANFTCHEGYILTPHNFTSVTCLSNGSWSNTVPTCTLAGITKQPGYSYLLH